MIGWGIGMPFIIINAIAIDNFSNNWLLFEAFLMVVIPIGLSFWIIHPVLKYLDKYESN